MKFKERNNSSNRGITLIALVVTIIVLLILAGISIMTLTGDNGIIVKTGKAKESTGNAQITEEFQLAINALVVDYYSDSKLKNGPTFIDYVFSSEEGKGQEKMKSLLGAENLEFDTTNLRIIYKGNAFSLSSDGKVIKSNIAIAKIGGITILGNFEQGGVIHLADGETGTPAERTLLTFHVSWEDEYNLTAEDIDFEYNGSLANDEIFNNSLQLLIENGSLHSADIKLNASVVSATDQPQTITLKVRNAEHDFSIGGVNIRYACKKCNGTGSYKKTCTECEGYGNIYTVCDVCQGQGHLQQDCPDCVGGQVKCSHCNGSGVEPGADPNDFPACMCSVCKDWWYSGIYPIDTGYVPCNKCFNDWTKNGADKGNIWVSCTNDDCNDGCVSKACDTCKGTGFVSGSCECDNGWKTTCN